MQVNRSSLSINEVSQLAALPAFVVRATIDDGRTIRVGRGRRGIIPMSLVYGIEYESDTENIYLGDQAPVEL